VQGCIAEPLGSELLRIQRNEGHQAPSGPCPKLNSNPALHFHSIPIGTVRGSVQWVLSEVLDFARIQVSDAFVALRIKPSSFTAIIKLAFSSKRPANLLDFIRLPFGGGI
jgi:hypothetical protein